MRQFTEFFLMSTGDAERYAVEKLGMFSPGEALECHEIGDGNINYVFKVRAVEDGRSVIIKQADRLLRSSGRPLDVRRSRIEAEILQIEGELAPGFVPEVYSYDPVMSATAMEDVSAYGNLRRELAAGHVYGHLAENISSFLALTLLPTTDLVLDKAEKKERVKRFTNPELCDITEELVLSEPFNNWRGRNSVFPGNEDFVRQELYENAALHAEVGKLRERFMNYAQALLHGDLHTGSIFANDKGIKVLDPEFAFYGPMGYDIGNVIGNFVFALANKRFTAPEDKHTAAALEGCIEQLCNLTRGKLTEKYAELVKLDLYRTEGFMRSYIDSVMEDSFGYAGTEILRRTVGDSKVMEISSVSNPEQRIPMERALIRMGSWLVMERGSIRSGEELTDKFNEITAV